jgi:hypothetical protein
MTRYHKYKPADEPRNYMYFCRRCGNQKVHFRHKSRLWLITHFWKR